MTMMTLIVLVTRYGDLWEGEEIKGRKRTSQVGAEGCVETRVGTPTKNRLH